MMVLSSDCGRNELVSRSVMRAETRPAQCIVRRCIFCFVLTGMFGLCGCGQSAPPAQGKSPAKNSSVPTAPSSVPQTTENASERDQLVRIDKNGRKWLGNVPYDVWFDDPLTVADDRRPTGPSGGDTQVPVTQSPAPQADEPAEDPPSDAGADWANVVSAAVLNAEIKKIRNEIAGYMGRVGQYNSHYKDVKFLGATLAALGGVLAEHPDADKGAQRGPMIRDIGTQIEQAANGLGMKSYKAAQIPLEQLTLVLSGGRPSDVAELPEDVPLSERADRGGLMKRMQGAFEWLKKNITNEAEFKRQLEPIEHESGILAALTKVIADESYESAGDPEYSEEAAGLLQSARGLTEAAIAKNFEAFSKALNNAEQRCIRCHTDYR